MRRAPLVVSVCLLALGLFQASCEKRTFTPGVTDWDAVKAIISRYPTIFRLGLFDTEPDTQSFYREITSSYADIEEGKFTPGDPDHITLTWTDSLTGKLHYDSSGHPHEKSIVFKTRTRAYFERWGYINDPNRGWVLRRISGTVINSSPATSRDIDELHIVSDGVDVYVYQPGVDTLVTKDSTLAFGKGKEVTFTVEPGDTSDFLFLHLKEEEEYQKIPFVNNGDETFTASWTTTDDPQPGKPYYHAIVDLVSRESVAADTTEYDFKAWGIVYRIK